MGAIVVSSRTYDIAGSRNLVFGSLALSTSYATGGDTFTAANFGLNTVDQLRVYSAGGYSFQADLTNKKIKAFVSAGLTPAGTVAVPVVTVTGGQSAGAALQILPDSTSGVLGKTTATTMAIPGATLGIGSQAFTGTAVAAAALSEVASTTDLSATSVFYEAVGV